MSHIGPYWRGVTQRLQAEVEQMNQLIDHQGTKGAENELALVRIVERLIPTKFGVGSGILVDAAGKSSRQMDIVIYDRGNEPALFAQTNQILFPVENVLLCIEVKTTVTKTEIEDARTKKLSIEALQSSSTKPKLALFGYRAGISAATIATHLKEATDRGPAPDLTLVVALAFLMGEGYERGGLAGLQMRDNHDNPISGSWVEPDDSETTSATRDGIVHPIVNAPRNAYVLGESSRALLLFAEWLANSLADEGKRSVISAYINHEMRDLLPILE